MAYVTSACFDTLRYYDTRKGNDDSDIEFVSGNTCRELQLNPFRAAVAQLLCKRLKVQCKQQSVILTAAGELGAPCKNVKIKGNRRKLFLQSDQ
jgi:hypothetical protein